MKTLLTILILLISNLTFGQIEKLISFNSLNFQNHLWSDKKNDTQKKYWENGKIKIEYEQLHDSVKLRKEYYESGNLKSTVEVFQTYTISESAIEDINKPGTMKNNKQAGYEDVFNGKYVEYADNNLLKLKLMTGTFKNNTKVSEWTMLTKNNNLTVANFNSNGQLDGQYFEFYYNPESARKDTLWKGQYKVVKYFSPEINEWTYRPTGKYIEVVESVKVGTWKHYDIIGQLLETVVYNWRKNSNKPVVKEKKKVETPKTNSSQDIFTY